MEKNWAWSQTAVRERTRLRESWAKKKRPGRQALPIVYHNSRADSQQSIPNVSSFIMSNKGCVNISKTSQTRSRWTSTFSRSLKILGSHLGDFKPLLWILWTFMARGLSKMSVCLGVENLVTNLRKCWFLWTLNLHKLSIARGEETTEEITFEVVNRMIIDLKRRVMKN